ncbi:uncharacterized protein EKO05_0003797 [Ascochyta rabiei]|uniref:Uncharacterized protein n=1 Tax=Didymella rabiei TaxID=5454 RepID=A0A163C2D3_DIDRA|nr:uncharacterized protein EKO05_0003797 [Ascochyta rabiei]KZM22164.1 hypothetical protein ST47_g6759 [Ascochyta rabiei]UPX13281.1 hypothetical protein EKO05_0003797 [Ascochyta rabiei]
MAFGRRVNAAPAPTTDYGAPALRSNKLHRPLIAANHALHLISSLIVLGISGYFINKFTHNTHLVYWIALAAVDVFLYLPALALPALKTYKGYLAPLTWILSYLWLTAFIFAAQDYEYNGGCAVNSPRFVNKCSLKRTLEAFAFIAFFTTLVGTLLEARLWDVQRFKETHRAGVEKHHGVGAEPVVGAQPGVAAPTAPHETV